MRVEPARNGFPADDAMADRDLLQQLNLRISELRTDLNTRINEVREGIDDMNSSIITVSRSQAAGDRTVVALAGDIAMVRRDLDEHTHRCGINTQHGWDLQMILITAGLGAIGAGVIEGLKHLLGGH